MAYNSRIERERARARVLKEKRAEIVKKKIGLKNDVEQCMHNAGYLSLNARARARVFLYYLLYTRYATDRKDRGNKKYYFVRRVTSYA